MEDGQRPEDEPNYKHYSVAVAASMAGVAEETIRTLYDNGEITGFRNSSGHRMIYGGSLRRRMLSVGVSEAARIAEVSAWTVRSWYDAGHVTGYKTPSGRRRIDIASIKTYMEARRR